MPTYEYVCKSCGEHLEIVQSFKDDTLTSCPGCGGALRKVFGNIGIAFKGSGFYRNDSRSRPNDKAAASSSKGASSDGGSSSESSGGPDGSRPAASSGGTPESSGSSVSESSTASPKAKPTAAAS